VISDPVGPVTTEVELWTTVTFDDGIEVRVEVVTGFPVADSGRVKLIKQILLIGVYINGTPVLKVVTPGVAG
jgi:hypothetical protein